MLTHISKARTEGKQSFFSNFSAECLPLWFRTLVSQKVKREKKKVRPENLWRKIITKQHIEVLALHVFSYFVCFAIIFAYMFRNIIMF